jgi:hypothetical protein
VNKPVVIYSDFSVTFLKETSLGIGLLPATMKLGKVSGLIGGHVGEIEPDLLFYPLAFEVLSRLPNLLHWTFTAQIQRMSPFFSLEERWNGYG